LYKLIPLFGNTVTIDADTAPAEAAMAEFLNKFPIFNVTGAAVSPTAPGTLTGLPGNGGIDGNEYTPFAKGGDFGAGTLALVGEEGPELVKFGSAGTVIPAGPTAAMLNGPSSPLGDDKGQAALLDALRALAARMPDGDTQITITESVSPRATAEELVRVQSANRYLAGRS